MNDIILQSCREVFTNLTDTESVTDNTNPTTEDQANTDDMTSRPVDETTMTKDETQIQQMLKRQRVNNSPNRTEKRKKRTTFQYRQLDRENRLERQSDKQKKKGT